MTFARPTSRINVDLPYLLVPAETSFAMMDNYQHLRLAHFGFHLQKVVWLICLNCWPVSKLLLHNCSWFWLCCCVAVFPDTIRNIGHNLKVKLGSSLVWYLNVCEIMIQHLEFQIFPGLMCAVIHLLMQNTNRHLWFVHVRTVDLQYVSILALAHEFCASGLIIHFYKLWCKPLSQYDDMHM